MKKLFNEHIGQASKCSHRTHLQDVVAMYLVCFPTTCACSNYSMTVFYSYVSASTALKVWERWWPLFITEKVKSDLKHETGVGPGCRVPCAFSSVAFHFPSIFCFIPFRTHYLSGTHYKIQKFQVIKYAFVSVKICLW